MHATGAQCRGDLVAQQAARFAPNLDQRMHLGEAGPRQRGRRTRQRHPACGSLGVVGTLRRGPLDLVAEKRQGDVEQRHRRREQRRIEAVLAGLEATKRIGADAEKCGQILGCQTGEPALLPQPVADQQIRSLPLDAARSWRVRTSYCRHPLASEACFCDA